MSRVVLGIVTAWAVLVFDDDLLRVNHTARIDVTRPTVCENVCVSQSRDDNTEPLR